jgi:hypothetical protein
MPKLKVKPLEWYMENDPEELAEEGYTPLSKDFKLVGRDGYYCRGEYVWFEVGGVGYRAYPHAERGRARQYFCYDLTVNEESILPIREVEAMRTVLKTSRDSGVRKAIQACLRRHENALDLRETGRRAKMTRIKILGR